MFRFLVNFYFLSRPVVKFRSVEFLHNANKDTEIHLFMYSIVIYMETLKIMIGTPDCYINPTFGYSQSTTKPHSLPRQISSGTRWHQMSQMSACCGKTVCFLRIGCFLVIWNATRDSSDVVAPAHIESCDNTLSFSHFNHKVRSWNNVIRWMSCYVPWTWWFHYMETLSTLMAKH